MGASIRKGLETINMSIVLVSFYITLTQARVILKEATSIGKMFTRLACVQACEVFCYLMIDVEGPSSLWAVLPLA